MLEHAVVVGASMAGLLAAWAVAPHARRVTVIERDPLPDAPAARRGVPQGHHTHVLVQGGRDALVDLGLELDPTASGRTSTDAARDLKWFHYGVWKTRFESGLIADWCDRPRLEQAVRDRVVACRNVRLLSAHRVLGLLGAERSDRVRGVRTHDPADRETDHEADLVVDASGSGSRLPRWLADLGYADVQEDRIAVDIGYASRVYRRTDGMFRDWTVLAVYPRPPETRRAGVLYPLDDERFLVTLIGWVGDHPPDGAQGFLDFAASLPRPDLKNCLERAEPLGPVYRYGFPVSRWRRYERLPRWPEGLVAVGDAVCRFNPVYGQGMTVSARDAVELRRALGAAPDDLPADFARRLQATLARQRAAPWLLAAVSDFRFPEVEGRRPFGFALLAAYMQTVLELAGSNDQANRRFLEVIGFRAPPSALFQPAIAWQVVRTAFAARTRAPS